MRMSSAGVGWRRAPNSLTSDTKQPGSADGCAFAIGSHFPGNAAGSFFSAARCQDRLTDINTGLTCSLQDALCPTMPNQQMVLSKRSDQEK